MFTATRKYRIAWFVSVLISSICVTGTAREAGPVTEIPAGAIDGQNVSFRLGAVPKKGETIQVFRNGTALLEGSDYQVSGATLTMLSARPLPGDVLHVVYTPTVGRQAQPIRPLTSGIVSATAVTRAAELSMAAAREALTVEEQQVNRNVMGKGPGKKVLKEGYLNGSPIPLPKTPQSIRSFLQLEQQRGDTDYGTEGGRNVSAQGIDGLGDKVVHYQLHKDESMPESAAVPVTADDSTVVPPTGKVMPVETENAPTGSAIWMLQRNLQANKQERWETRNGSTSKPAHAKREKREEKREWQLWQ